MQDQTLITLFLAVIAVTSLLQTAFIVGLAVASRIAAKKVEGLRERFEPALVGHVEKLTTVTAAAERLADKGLAQAKRAESVLTDVEERVDAAFGIATSGLTRVAKRTDEAAGRLARRSRLGRKLSRASAFIAGLRRALEVWQESAPGEAEDDSRQSGEAERQERQPRVDSR